MKLILVRHGETEHTLNPPLTMVGVEQARYTAQFLASESLGDIYCSTSDCARATAEELRSRQSNSRVISLQELNEQNKYNPHLFQPESLPDFVQRVTQTKKELIDSSTVDLTIVGHNTYINVLMGLLLKLTHVSDLQHYHCSITRFERIGPGWAMHAIDSTSHLLELMKTYK